MRRNEPHAHDECQQNLHLEQMLLEKGWRDTTHKMPTVQQKYIMFGNAKCKPFTRNTQSSGSQNANRPAEMKSPGQPSRILKSSVPYHSATVTGRGLAEEDDFEVIRRAAIDADAYLG